MIEKACERAIEAKPSSANFAYINGILENWNKNNVKTFEDIDRLDREFVAKAGRRQRTSNISSFNNFKQTKLDNELTEMEELFLKEVNYK